MAAPDGVGDDAGPAGLVGGTQAGAVVAVEVLVEQQVVLPGRVGLEPLDAAEAGPAAVGADQEDRDQALAQVLGDLAERQLLPRPGRVLDLERVAEEAVVALQRLEDQVVEGNHSGPRQLELPPNMAVVDSAGS